MRPGRLDPKKYEQERIARAVLRGDRPQNPPKPLTPKRRGTLR